MPSSEDSRNDLHRYLLQRFGVRGEALYVGALGFIAIMVNGFAAYFLKYPLLFPSLAPTIFHIFRSPLDEGASPRNTITGHFVGLIVGFFSLAIFGLLSTPSVIQKGATLPHVGAAAVSLALAEAILIYFNRVHPPAATTTLLVSLGIFKSFSELLSLAAGILLLTVTCWILNRSVGVPVPPWSPREQQEN
jgi:CBS-domain-containing membrane protein